MRIIIVHGFNANPDMCFYPWLKDELRQKGYEVVVPKLSLSLTEDFSVSKIIDELKQQVGYLDKTDILIGHSLGAFIILRYLEAVEMTETPRGIILVAAPWKVARPELRHLFIADLDADVLMWKAREFVVIHSSDDKLVPVDHGKTLATALRARWIQTTGDDHYMGTSYPILLQTIIEMAEKPHEFAPGLSLPNQFEESLTPKPVPTPDINNDIFSV